MKLRGIFCLCLLALLVVAMPMQASAQDDVPAHVYAFELERSKGYRISVFAISEWLDREAEVSVSVTRGKSGFAAYRAPAVVTAEYLQADLGPFGRIDMALNRSGRERTIPVRCSKGQKYSFEPGVFEGLAVFRGEADFVRSRTTRSPLRPLVTSFCDSGSGKGESSGDGVGAGARLRGHSFAGGRRLNFQVNKNHQRGRAPFSAEIRERRDGISIYRAAEGWLPTTAFQYAPNLRTARLSPPAPFSGSASLSRRPDSVPPQWSGNLAIDFPGRTARLAGPDVHVSLVHACFRLFDEPRAESC